VLDKINGEWKDLAIRKTLTWLFLAQALSATKRARHNGALGVSVALRMLRVYSDVIVLPHPESDH